MLLIKNQNFKRVGHDVDFELENGVLLYSEDWNTEIYTNGYNPENEKETNCQYRPIYRYEIEKLILDEIEENSDEWYKATEILGFEEF